MVQVVEIEKVKFTLPLHGWGIFVNFLCCFKVFPIRHQSVLFPLIRQSDCSSIQMIHVKLIGNWNYPNFIITQVTMCTVEQFHGKTLQMKLIALAN